MSRTLADIYADLSFGSLAGMSIGADGAGGIQTGKENRMVYLVNQGLRELYSRFLIYEKELIIRIIDGRQLYPLEAQFALFAGSAVDRFIIDTAEQPFTFDLITVLSAFDPDEVEIPLNDYDNDASVFTPAPEVLQIPDDTGAVAGESYRFLYQARHPILGVGDDTQLVRLPDGLYNALERYVASRIFSAMNGQEHRRRGAELYAEFEMICGMVRDNNGAKTSMANTTTKLDERGFV